VADDCNRRTKFQFKARVFDLDVSRGCLRLVDEEIFLDALSKWLERDETKKYVSLANGAVKVD